jgi:hypothetical protein
MDVRPASVAVQQAADVLMLRWTAGDLGSGEAADVAALRFINALDWIAGDLAGIEAQRGGATARPFCDGAAARTLGVARLAFMRDALEQSRLTAGVTSEIETELRAAIDSGRLQEGGVSREVSDKIRREALGLPPETACVPRWGEGSKLRISGALQALRVRLSSIFRLQSRSPLGRRAPSPSPQSGR